MSDGEMSSYKQLLDDWIENVDRLSEDEILSEGIEEYGSEEAISAAFDNALQEGKRRAKKAQLVRAREGYEREAARSRGKSQLLNLPLEKKKELLDKVAQKVDDRDLTLAAREGTDDEKDVDSLLSAYIRLGLLDDEQ